LSETLESFDGLCGIIAEFSSSELQLRCKHELGHHGSHSWEKYRKQFTIQSFCGIDRSEQEFINSVLYHNK
jgi:hypothetical protein